jgi:hypothetical protein
VDWRQRGKRGGGRNGSAHSARSTLTSAEATRRSRGDHGVAPGAAAGVAALQDLC